MATAPARVRQFLALPPEERRLGPFRLLRLLGRGGFAPVWLAEESYAGTAFRTVALKLFPLRAINPDRPGGDDGSPRPAGRSLPGSARDPVLEEARLLCQVEHPNIVRFFSLPMDPERGIVGLAMEYVDGRSVAQWLGEHGELSVAETLAIGVAVASALTAVHRAGLVHRDVKPANVVESAGVPKLIDFGIAAASALGARPVRAAPQPRFEIVDDLPLERAASQLSTLAEDGLQLAGAGDEDSWRETLRGISGTLGYVDPICVALLAPASEASDLYGLGAMLYECLTGMVPAAAATSVQGRRGLCSEVLDGRARPPPVRTIAPAVPEALGALVDQLLSPDRKDRPRSAEAVALVLETLKAERVGRPRALPPEEVGPFRGLGRFESSDRDVYFGRSVEVATVLELLRSRGLVALVGPSGSGKSSLARAGVLPAIATGALQGRPREWDTVVASPGLDPRAAIAAALAEHVPEAERLEPEALTAALVGHLDDAGRGLILLLDQAEELLALADEAPRRYALRLLGEIAASPRPGLRALVCLRHDTLDALLALGGMGRSLLGAAVSVAPLPPVAWASVIDQALAAYGYSFEDDALRQLVLDEAALTAASMPLVQFALAELWSRRDPDGKRLTRAGYEAMGGIGGALERHAEATVAELRRADAEATEAWLKRRAEGRAHALGQTGRMGVVRRVLLALTTPQGLRTTGTLAALGARIDSPFLATVLGVLERGRLVVAGPDGVTLAHEALLTQWGRLRRWLAEARQDRLLAEELEADARRWAADPEAVAPWRTRRLAAAVEVASRGEVELSAEGRLFLAAGRRSERRRHLGLGAAAAGAAVLAVAGAIAYVSTTEAHQDALGAALRQAEADRARAEQERRQAQAAEATANELRQRADAARRKAEALGVDNAALVAEVAAAGNSCSRLRRAAGKASARTGVVAEPRTPSDRTAAGRHVKGLVHIGPVRTGPADKTPAPDDEDVE